MLERGQQEGQRLTGKQKNRKASKENNGRLLICNLGNFWNVVGGELRRSNLFNVKYMCVFLSSVLMWHEHEPSTEVKVLAVIESFPNVLYQIVQRQFTEPYSCVWSVHFSLSYSVFLFIILVSYYWMKLIYWLLEYFCWFLGLPTQRTVSSIIYKGATYSFISNWIFQNLFFSFCHFAIGISQHSCLNQHLTMSNKCPKDPRYGKEN